MQTTLKAVYITLQIAPFVALLFALPYTIMGYVKTKSVNVWKCTYFYTFILYFLCAYFITMLPLPTPESLANLKPISEYIQLVPFQSFMDIERETLFRDIAIILFNVLLTVPLGFFLRYFFGMSFKKTVFIGFMTSMLYEITQLTGLFFIYPRPYRFFDVDDLMINTLGALIGYIIVPVLAKFLPKTSDKESLRLTQGSEVSFVQRTVASAIDFVITGVFVAVAVFLVQPLRAVLTDSGSLIRFPLFFVIFMAAIVVYSLIFGSNTPGCAITGLRIRTTGGRDAGRVRCAGRSLFIHATVTAIPFWVFFLMNIYTEYAGARSLVPMLAAAGFMLIAARNVLEMMFNAVTHGSSMFYDRVFRTHLAYSSSRGRSLFGIHVIDILPLVRKNIDVLSDEICTALADAGIDKKSVTKVRLMAEGVMLDWLNTDLSGTTCELRLDNRFRSRAIMVSVPGENKTKESKEDTYVDMLGKMELRLETYYAAEKNICIIHIP